MKKFLTMLVVVGGLALTSSTQAVAPPDTDPPTQGVPDHGGSTLALLAAGVIVLFGVARRLDLNTKRLAEKRGD